MLQTADGVPFTDRELDVMRALWRHGGLTVAEYRDARNRTPGDPYTSDLSVFQTLERKGFITHDREGRAYRYLPDVTRGEAQVQVLGYVFDGYFEGDAEELWAILDRIRDNRRDRAHQDGRSLT